jgi:carboxymethylenebutenolidase
MPRFDVDVATADGTCPAVLVTPEGEGPWPAVIMFPDAGGLRPTMVQMAEQLAGMGYVAFVPEMYYRSGPYEPFDVATAFSDPGERARMMGMIAKVSKADAARDAGAFLDFLAAHPKVAGDRFGTTGYCMGGGLSLTAAAHHPDRIAAAASFHGGNLANDTPDSPHLVAGQIRGRVYVAAADNDPSFPHEQAERLEASLTAGGVDHTIETYPALHGFAVPDNTSYDTEAAARHWRALESLYGATLHG